MSILCFSQASGTFTGTLNQITPISNAHSFVAVGNGYYTFTGNYSGTGNWLTPTAFIGSLNNYNIGGNYDANGNLAFNTTCVENGQTIGIYIESNHNDGEFLSYSLSYQFVPTSYGVDAEPNDNYGQAINTVENTNYEGWFNVSDPDNQDSEDWYRFTAPRDGRLTIIVDSDFTFSSQYVEMLLYDNNGQIVTTDSVEDSGATRTFTYENFNESGNNFGIWLHGSCTSYQFSWNIESTATTIINDSNFEQLLVNLGYDDIVDGSVLTQNIENVTSLDISSSNISNLTGIEDFSSLVSFTSIQNPLTAVDFSNNLNLETVNIINNPITSVNVSQNIALADLTVSTQTGTLNSIDVSQNINLTSLELGANNLSTLNVSNNTLLTYLNVGNNPIANLDISNNLALESIGIYYTSITDLDLSNHPNIQSVLCYNGLLETLNLQNGNNSNTSKPIKRSQILSSLDATNNPNLLCIQVDNVASAESNSNWLKDAFAIYSLDCASTLGVEKNDISNLVELYPNPVKDVLTIKYVDAVNNIEIYNLMGKKIKSFEQPNKKIQLNEIQSGIYFFMITTDFGTVVKKVVKE